LLKIKKLQTKQTSSEYCLLKSKENATTDLSINQCTVCYLRK